MTTPEATPPAPEEISELDRRIDESMAYISRSIDRLLRIEAAAREFAEAQDADTGHPARDAARIADAVDALRAALDEESQP